MTPMMTNVSRRLRRLHKRGRRGKIRRKEDLGRRMRKVSEREAQRGGVGAGKSLGEEGRELKAEPQAIETGEMIDAGGVVTRGIGSVTALGNDNLTLLV